MSGSSYHHGDLRSALVRATRELIARDGVGAVSVRAVARAVGVSHAAPAHHFGDREGLVAAVAAEEFVAFRETLVAAIDAVRDEDPDATAADGLVSMGRAYIGFGLAHPEWYAVMFRPEMVDHDDPELADAGAAAFETVCAMVRACLVDGAPDDSVFVGAMMVWSTTHGFVSLAHDLPVGEDVGVELTPLAQEAVTHARRGLAGRDDWIGDEAPLSRLPDDLSDPIAGGPHAPISQA